MKIKTTELQREALDRMVAKCEVGLHGHCSCNSAPRFSRQPTYFWA
jgi:hypothetical protein